MSHLTYFNPRSCEGSDLATVKFSICFLISIHAPARGATCLDDVAIKFIQVSIHAPARGATTRDHVLLSFSLSFNPRSREGSDHSVLYKYILLYVFQSTLPRGERHFQTLGKSVCQSVSIHAPARGATHTKTGVRFWDTVSIHAPARGATELDPFIRKMPKEFQSTLPRGERRSISFIQMLH